MVRSFFESSRNSLLGLVVLLIVTAGAATGHAGERVMVVFDASGSMWGQIEGRTKIEIARGVLRRTLTDWKGRDMEAGLIVYGHRRKGDCGDIQTLIPSGPIDTGAFSRAVEKIKPKGKTPLTDAVRRAAEELKYTEEKATVILMSDGKETCDVDPCAVAKELEENGVDFTAHVIGFDVAKEADRKQLQCLAENTGGMFVSAKDANELSVAFERVTDPSPLTLTAVNKADGREVPGPVSWSLKGGDVQIDKTTKTARLELPDVPDGSYSVKVEAGPYKGQGSFKLADQRPPTLNIELVAPRPKLGGLWEARFKWKKEDWLAGMTVCLRQDGDKVTGTYTWDGGKKRGTLEGRIRGGDRLEYRYAGSDCKDAGTFRIKPDGSRLAGPYRCGSGTGLWELTRTGRPCALAVKWQTESLGSFTVDAKANVFGASDKHRADGQAPTIVTLPARPGRIVTFANVKGQWSCCGGASPNGPEGGGTYAPTTVKSSHPALSDAIHQTRTMYLAGVFVSTSASAGKPPPLKYPGPESKARIAPVLNQVFYVGKGLAASGKPQEVLVPETATHILLGIADAGGFSGRAGAYPDNTGQVTLEIKFETGSR